MRVCRKEVDKRRDSGTLTSCVQIALKRSMAVHLNSSARVKSENFGFDFVVFAGDDFFGAGFASALVGANTPALGGAGPPFFAGLTMSVAYSSLSILSHLASWVRTSSPPCFRMISLTFRLSDVSSDVNLTLKSMSSMSCSSLRFGISPVPLTTVPSSVSPAKDVNGQ